MNPLLYLVQFNYEGRGFSLDGVFICEADKYIAALGKEVYLGEVAGKHSEVVLTLDTAMIEVINEDQAFITQMQEQLGKEWSVGYNPIQMLADAEEDEE